MYYHLYLSTHSIHWLAAQLLIDKEGNKQPMVDKRGRFYLLEEIDPDFLKTNVNQTLYQEYAAMKLTLMLMGGSAFLLVGILGIYFRRH